MEDNQKVTDVDYRIKRQALRAAGLEGYTDHLSQADQAVRWEKYNRVLRDLDREIEQGMKAKGRGKI
jgi:hypothetical protein